jgi:hypothetical protein
LPLIPITAVIAALCFLAALHEGTLIFADEDSEFEDVNPVENINQVFDGAESFRLPQAVPHGTKDDGLRKAIRMRARHWVVILAALATVAGAGPALGAVDGRDAGGGTAASAAKFATPPAAVTPALAVSSALLQQPQPADRCALAEVTANPTRPAWDYAASTTQCGVAEVDSGWMEQPVGGGVRQQMSMSSLRYGLTPKLDLRWGLTNHIVQSGGGTAPLEGIGDQWVNARYRFLEQEHWMPAMALLYGIKVPTANPAKGFGSGFYDQQYILIASRDLGRNHLDFNTVGTVTGAAHGHDGAAQFGLALTRPLSAKLSWILESYGGPQPGTSDRFGAAFTGATYTLRSTLVVDGAYSRTYTAGSPRQQFLFGMTFAMRPGFLPLPRNSSVARLLGR